MIQPDNNLPPYDYDEIDLRDILRTLGKWKKVIAGVTILCMLLSGVYSFFLIDPVFEAKVLVTPASISRLSSEENFSYIITDDVKDQFTDSKRMTDNMDNIIKLSQVDVNHYKVVITSNYILKRTIDSLNLKLKPEQIKDMVSIEENKDDPEVSEVIVRDIDPKRAPQIANTLIREATLYLNDMNQKKMNELLLNLQSQLQLEKKDLDLSFTALKQYRLQVGIDNAVVASRNDLEEDKLLNEVNRREDMVNSLSSKILELKVLQSFESAEDKIVVLSAATAPENPIKPNKKLNVVIAGVLGLMLAVFGVFLMEYMKKDDDQ